MEPKTAGHALTRQTAPPFVSSMVDDASYDDENEELTLTINGHDYTLPSTKSQWESFKNAPSKGNWVRTELEGYAQ